MHAIDSIVALVLVATVVAMITRKLRLPYTIALVVVGIGMHEIGLVPKIHLTRELLMNVLLPALLFEAAIHVPIRELRRVSGTVITLAVPGVVVAMLTTGLVLLMELYAVDIGEILPWQLALLFGALIAATDPISVVALFKQLGAPKDLGVLVEGESLLNDGTGVVVFGIILGMATGENISAGGAIWQFVLVFVGGALIGSAVGLLGSWVTAQIDDHLIEIALTTVVAWGAFLLAERINVSGVIATVVAGLFVGNIGKHRGMSPVTRIAVLSFWEYASFFINSLVFLLLGLEVSLASLWQHKAAVVLAFIAVLIGRALVVFGTAPILKRFFGQPMGFANSCVLFWGGLRGSLSMVLALSLPHDLPGRDLIVTMTFGVVLASILIQGTTMGVLLRFFGLVHQKTEASAWLESRIARLQVMRAQEEALNQLTQQHAEPGSVVAPLRETLRQHRMQVEDELNTRLRAQDDHELEQALALRQTELRQRLDDIAKDEIRELISTGFLGTDQAAKLSAVLAEENEAPS